MLVSVSHAWTKRWKASAIWGSDKTYYCQSARRGVPPKLIQHRSNSESQTDNVTWINISVPFVGTVSTARCLVLQCKALHPQITPVWKWRWEQSDFHILESYTYEVYKLLRFPCFAAVRLLSNRISPLGRNVVTCKPFYLITGHVQWLIAYDTLPSIGVPQCSNIHMKQGLAVWTFGSPWPSWRQLLPNLIEPLPSFGVIPCITRLISQRTDQIDVYEPVDIVCGVWPERLGGFSGSRRGKFMRWVNIYVSLLSYFVLRMASCSNCPWNPFVPWQ